MTWWGFSAVLGIHEVINFKTQSLAVIIIILINLQANFALFISMFLQVVLDVTCQNIGFIIDLLFVSRFERYDAY